MREKIGNSVILNQLKKLKNIKTDKLLAEVLKIENTKLANWRNRDSVDLYVIKAAFPEVDANWLLNPEGPIQIISEVSEKKYPLIYSSDIKDFLSGSFRAQSFITNSLADKLNCDFFTEKLGDAMAPKYKKGDIIGCQLLSDKDTLRPGNVYGIFTKQGFLVTRIDKLSPNKKTLYCVNENKKYKPFEIHSKEIEAISLVHCAVTFN